MLPKKMLHVRTRNGLLTGGWERSRGSLLAPGPVSSVAARLATTALKRTQKGSEDEWTGLVECFIFGVGLLIRRDAPQLAVDLALEVARSV
jgi:hypothetical protein